MGTKVQTVAQAAGVTCPKDTGEMDRNEPCSKCEHYHKCLGQISRVLGLPGNDD